MQTFDGIFAAPGTNVGSVSADGIAPRLIASYALSDDVQLNAQISKGFRLGGINDPLNVPLCTPEDLVTFGGRDTWDDEVLWNYEIGAKANVLEGRGTFNVAAFFMDIDDLQATVTAGSCSSRVVFNVPEARSQGVELEYSARLSQAFDFALSASFIDSGLTESRWRGPHATLSVVTNNLGRNWISRRVPTRIRLGRRTSRGDRRGGRQSMWAKIVARSSGRVQSFEDVFAQSKPSIRSSGVHASGRSSQPSDHARYPTSLRGSTPAS